MPKFYVVSGDVREIIDRPDSQTAALDVLQSLTNKPNVALSAITVASEQGFCDTTDIFKALEVNDGIFDTIYLLEKLNLLDQFHPENWL